MRTIWVYPWTEICGSRSINLRYFCLCFSAPSLSQSSFSTGMRRVLDKEDVWFQVLLSFILLSGWYKHSPLFFIPVPAKNYWWQICTSVWLSPRQRCRSESSPTFHTHRKAPFLLRFLTAMGPLCFDEFEEKHIFKIIFIFHNTYTQSNI